MSVCVKRTKTTEEAAYLAGFVDGEGSITLYHHKLGNGEKRKFYPRLSVCNTDKSVMEYLHKNWGGHLAWTQPDKNRPKGLWRLDWYARQDLLVLLPLLIPYLHIKKKRCELLLLWCNLRSEHSNAYTRYTEKELQVAEQFREA